MTSISLDFHQTVLPDFVSNTAIAVKPFFLCHHELVLLDHWIIPTCRVDLLRTKSPDSIFPPNFINAVIGERPPYPVGNQPTLRVPSIQLVAHRYSKHQPRSFCSIPPDLWLLLATGE